jgi:hypothetical protein
MEIPSMANHWNADAARRARVKQLGEDIAHRLEGIHDLFKAPVKLTLIIRDPAFPDGSRDTYQTNDQWPLARAAVDRLLAQPDNEIYVGGSPASGSGGA